MTRYYALRLAEGPFDGYALEPVELEGEVAVGDRIDIAAGKAQTPTGLPSTRRFYAIVMQRQWTLIGTAGERMLVLLVDVFEDK